MVKFEVEKRVKDMLSLLINVANMLFIYFLLNVDQGTRSVVLWQA
jgi:hypothetical protein